MKTVFIFKKLPSYFLYSTAQYEEDYLERFGCGSNGRFIKGGEEGEVEVDCTPAPDCHLFETKCCETSTGPPIVSPCVDSPDCELFGQNCCEPNSGFVMEEGKEEPNGGFVMEDVEKKDCTPPPCHPLSFFGSCYITWKKDASKYVNFGTSENKLGQVSESG